MTNEPCLIYGSVFNIPSEGGIYSWIKGSPSCKCSRFIYEVSMFETAFNKGFKPTTVMYSHLLHLTVQRAASKKATF